MFTDGQAYGWADGRTDRCQAHGYIPQTFWSRDKSDEVSALYCMKFTEYQRNNDEYLYQFCKNRGVKYHVMLPSVECILCTNTRHAKKIGGIPI